MFKTQKFEIVTTKMGVLSIRDNLTQEIMHNPVGPWVEANALYIDQSQLKRRIAEHPDREFVVFDVGLGAAANALAALHAAKDLPSRSPLRLISFERDLDLLEFALAHSSQFAHFAGFEAAVEAILRHGSWDGEGVHWELRHGNFVELIEKEPFRADLVFFDPYSSKKNIEMWVTETFRRVRARCADGGMLFTYSRATPVRVGMLLGGFFVGVGRASGAKDETTQAAVRLQDLDDPLAAAWLDKWKRSHQANAFGARDEDFPATREFVLSHPQFNG